jgi:hypothetical protein
LEALNVNYPTQIMPELERITDASALRTVLYALSQMRYEKADHIESTWQDKATAQPWKRAARSLDRLAFKTTVDNI